MITDRTPIECLPLQRRTIQALQGYGIREAGELRLMTDRRMLKIHGIGYRSLWQIRDAVGRARWNEDSIR